MNLTPIFSKTTIKIAGTCLGISAIGCWFMWDVLTIPLWWMLRPLFVAAAVLTAGIAIGAALRMQGGDTDGR